VYCRTTRLELEQALKRFSLLAASLLALAACDTGPSSTPGYSVPETFCTYPFWIEYRPYAVGSIVTYRGKLYYAKHENPGYIPGVSTYYWTEIPAWAAAEAYNAGNITNYQGKMYVAKVDKPDSVPGANAAHWAEQGCPR
jgi:chitodextrinase